MIKSRTIEPSTVSNKIFENGNFYVVRSGKNFLKINHTATSVSMCPCDETGSPILSETVEYNRQTGRKAVVEFLKLLPFKFTYHFDTRKS